MGTPGLTNIPRYVHEHSSKTTSHYNFNTSGNINENKQLANERRLFTKANNYTFIEKTPKKTKTKKHY